MSSMHAHNFTVKIHIGVLAYILIPGLASFVIVKDSHVEYFAASENFP